MPYNYRAGVHYARKNYAAAIRDHMEALKRDPRHAGTFNQLAWVWSTSAHQMAPSRKKVPWS